MRTNDTKSGRVKTADTLFDIVEYLQEHQEGRVSEIADALDIAPSTAHRHLATLYDREYVIKHGDVYKLGLRFLDLGETARGCYELYSLARAKVDQLAEETNERVQLLVEEHGYGVYLYVARGQQAVRTDPGIGRRVPLYVAAAGKAILAHLPEERTTEILHESDLETFTPHSITDVDTLADQLERIRDRGYGVNDQEFIQGLRAVGVPITTPDGRVLGALSVSGPKHRMKGSWLHEELPDLLLGTATEIELNMAYS